MSEKFEIPKEALLTRKGEGFKEYRQEITRIQYCTMTILLEKGLGVTAASKVFNTNDHTKAITARNCVYHRLSYDDWEYTYNIIKQYVQSINWNDIHSDGERQDTISGHETADGASQQRAQLELFNN